VILMGRSRLVDESLVARCHLSLELWAGGVLTLSVGGDGAALGVFSPNK